MQLTIWIQPRIYFILSWHFNVKRYNVQTLDKALSYSHPFSFVI